MILTGNRANETYTYRRVQWGSFQEGEDLGNVTGGSVELAALSQLKATCQFSFMGAEPDPNDLVRIYYAFDDDAGEHGEFCIGTFLIGFASVTNTADYVGDQCKGLVATGTADGWSVLKVLQDVSCGYPLTIPQGTNAIAEAIRIIQSAGLPVQTGAESNYTLSTDHTFEPTDTLLTVVDWLCTTAGYQAPFPDAFGNVQFAAYISPNERNVVARFANDDESIMYPEVQVENDWQSIPNVYKLSYSTEELALHAEARNVSGSKASLQSRGGRELSATETVTELAGGSADEKGANLQALAEQRLLDNSQEIERVQLSHPYIPLVANDAVAIDYAGRSWAGNVQNMRVDLSPSTKCDTTIRRFISNNIKVQSSYMIDWEAE